MDPAIPVTPPSHRGSLIYGLEDRPPIGVSLLVAVQHVSAMVVGTITPPLILAGILKFPAAETAYLVSVALLASALGEEMGLIDGSDMAGPMGAARLAAVAAGGDVALLTERIPVARRVAPDAALAAALAPRREAFAALAAAAVEVAR